MSFLRSRKSPSGPSRGECANSPFPAPQPMASPRHPRFYPPKGSKQDLSPRDPPGKASLTGGALAEVPSSRRPRRPQRGLRIPRQDHPRGEATPLPTAQRDPRPSGFALQPPYSLPMAAAQHTRRAPAGSQLPSFLSSRIWPRRRRLGTESSRPRTSSAHGVM